MLIGVKLAKREAASMGISVAGFVRRAEMLPAGTAAWMRFAGFVESGDGPFQPVHRRFGVWHERLNAMSIPWR